MKNSHFKEHNEEEETRPMDRPTFILGLNFVKKIRCKQKVIRTYFMLVDPTPNPVV